MIIRKYNNGTFRVKRDWEDDENLVVALCNSSEADFVPLGEEYCLGGAIGMAQDLYNPKTGKVYMITYDADKKWRYHYNVWLRGYAPTENDLERLACYGY